MALRIVRLGTPRARAEGLRLGTVRRPPRGVRKTDYARKDFFDVWLPELAPSDALLSYAHEGPLTPKRWATFARRYHGEMRRPPAQRLLRFLAALSRQANLSVGCFCSDEARCHRSLLRELLKKAGAKVAVIPILLALLVSPGSAQQPAPAGLTVTTAQLGSLRWLVGNWQGSMENGDHFYEGYAFLNDSTIQTFSYPDSTTGEASDSGSIELRGGKVTTGDAGTRWIVTAMDSASIRFDPLRNARNTFTWILRSPDHWTATLEWKDRQGNGQKRVYEMRRLTRTE
jgi:uncharacterized protein YeaO (DUF488 family)